MHRCFVAGSSDLHPTTGEVSVNLGAAPSTRKTVSIQVEEALRVLEQSPRYLRARASLLKAQQSIRTEIEGSSPQCLNPLFLDLFEVSARGYCEMIADRSTYDAYVTILEFFLYPT